MTPAEKVKAAQAANDTAPPYVIEHAASLAEPLPPLEWLCKGLRLARGSVTIIGGYGYSRKTLYAQSLAISVASGNTALGIYQTTKAPVLHIDYEQGQRITRERYQRLARAMNINIAESLLCTATFPSFRLSDSKARDIFHRMLEESSAGFVILDSLRAATSGIDENSSEIREIIDLVGQECKSVNAAAMIIHHARKPAEGKAAGHYALRGSGAIFDAADGVFIFAAAKGEPTTVSHEKDRLVGSELDDFGLNTEDIEHDGDPRWGLRLVHLEAEQVREREEAKQARGAEQSLDRTKAAIRRYLVSHGGRFEGSKGQLRDALGVKRDAVFAAFAEMLTSGELRIEGSQRDQVITLCRGVQ